MNKFDSALFFTLLQILFLFEHIQCQNSSLVSRFIKLEKDVDANTKLIKYLEQKNQEMQMKLDSFSEHCKSLPDDVCGSCLCKDDDRLLAKYYCDCRNLQPKRDCLEFYRHNIKINGIYKIHQNILKIIQVYCDQTTEGGGWTAFQRRVDGSVNFFRDWENYKYGFGQLQNEFWLGNDNIFTMSLQGLYPKGNDLRIDMKNWKGVYGYVKYKQFQVGNENTFYLLHVGKFSGTATNGGLINGAKFSTYDSYHGNHKANCPRVYESGWWFYMCFYTNLNGVYRPAGKTSRATGIHWGVSNHFNSYYESLVFVEMKMRRNL